MKQENITNEIKVKNKDMEVLKKHFSHCFDKSGDFQIDKFKQSLTEQEVNFSRESYSMDWLGKSYARLLASDPATTLLKEDKVHNSQPENKDTENLLLKGDNLEVLKHLSNAYYEKIKMIYIDPPYNTGSDGFVYQDDRKFSVEELRDLTGIDKERAERILDFTQSKSNSHSAWLTFMYPRLYIAKRLLKEDGVIFISIDDNEFAQLKLMMDEIFGEENYVETLKWKRKKQPSFLARHTASVMEYILIYAKRHSSLEKLSIETISDSTKKVINNTNEASIRLFDANVRVKVDGEGIIKKGEYKGRSMVVEYLEDVKYKNGFTLNPVKVKAQFSVSQKLIDEFIEEDLLFITKNFGLRRDVSEEEKSKRKSITDLILDWGDNQESDNEIKGLFGDRVFNYTKPSSLIFNLVKSNFTVDNITLDFFAGSGTTGDAVMQLNAKDGGNRKFILVQLPETIDKKDKAPYNFVTKELKLEPTIFEITKERLLRAAKKINQELDEENVDLKAKIKTLEAELPTDENQEDIEELIEKIHQNKQVQSQNSFKVFETMPIWEDYHFETKELDEQLALFDESKLTDEDIQALLTTWKTYDGVSLTTATELVDLDTYKAYYTSNKLYLMDKGFTTEALKALVEKIDTDKTFNPTSIIVFGYHFESKSLRELAENLKSYSNKKNIDIDFITRY